jgi:hypothetical protein
LGNCEGCWCGLATAGVPGDFSAGSGEELRQDFLSDFGDESAGIGVGVYAVCRGLEEEKKGVIYAPAKLSRRQSSNYKIKQPGRRDGGVSHACRAVCKKYTDR